MYMSPGFGLNIVDQFLNDTSVLCVTVKNVGRS